MAKIKSLPKPLPIKKPAYFEGFAWNKNEFLKMLESELDKGHVITTFRGFDAFGRFDGTYQVLGYINPYFEANKVG